MESSPDQGVPWFPQGWLRGADTEEWNATSNGSTVDLYYVLDKYAQPRTVDKNPEDAAWHENVAGVYQEK